MVNLINVLVDYQVNPIGIDNKSPSFSWAYSGDSFTQTFYRIKVYSSLENLNADKPDMWDSKKVSSSLSSGIIYNGKPLESRKSYYFIIEVNGLKSDINYFETGLLNKSDWVADFIGAPTTRISSALLVRKDYVVKENTKVNKARIYLCGLGIHEFYINGIKISKGYLNPAVTDYNKRCLYEVYAFESYLKPGNNAIGIILGHGWLGARKLLAQVYITYEDGSEDFFYTTTCADWWMKGSYIIENSIFDGEVCDGNLRKELSNWCDPETEIGWSKGWLYSLLIEKPSGNLVKNRLEPIDEVSRYQVYSFKKVEGNTIYNFNQIFSGFVSIKVKGKKGSKVILKYGEQVDDKGHVNQLNLRTATARDIYILSGDGIEEYTPRFTYHGFQYVEVVIEGKAKIISIEGIYVRNNVALLSSFESNNETLNQLHRNVIMTEGSNLHGVFTDCPQRDERFGWLNDLTVRIYQNCLNYNLANFYPKVISDISDTQDNFGRIADTAPHVQCYKPADPVCLSYLSLGLESYKRYGNKNILIEEYDNFKAWVDYLTSQVDLKNASLYARFADWCAPGDFVGEEDPTSKLTPGEFISICFYYLHLIKISKIADILNKKEDCKRYLNMANDIKKSIVTNWYHKETNTFATGTQASNAIGLGLNLLNEEDSKKLAYIFNKSVIDKNYHLIVGNQTYYYAFTSLVKYGYIDTFIKTLTNKEYPGWGYMLANGATTIWERWEKEMKQKMHSYCHPMFGSFDAIFFNYILGIDIDDNSIAYDTINIKPFFSKEIKHVKGSLTTLKGEIKAEYYIDDNEVTLTLSLPLNTITNISLKGMYLINGKDVSLDCFQVKGGGSFVIKSHLEEVL